MLHHVSGGGAGGATVVTLTPPLTPRASPRLPSPASSPNLSCRSAPTANTLETQSGDPRDAKAQSVSDMQSKVLQLPPVNTWMPPGESLFSSILDSRSPQIYRRTTSSSALASSVGSSNKTASYPQASLPAPAQGSSRVSWPQTNQKAHSGSNTETLLTVTPPVVSITPDTGETLETDKSPRLLRKCTSFDMERSKPFPARAKISSPMLLRKVASVDDTHKEESQAEGGSPKLHKWTGSNLNTEPAKIVHREEEEDQFPHCESTADTGTHTTITPARGSYAGKEVALLQEECVFFDDEEYDVRVINESLEDPNIPETDILDDFEPDFEVKSFGEDTVTLPSEEVKTSDHLQSQQESQVMDQASDNESCATDLGAKPKTAKVTIDMPKSAEQSKTKDSKRQGNDSGDLASKKLRSKSVVAKSEKKAGDKPKRSSSTSAVKSALLSSAAKLKAMSRKSPVMLLSYKSHSISIPDHTSKANRLVSSSATDVSSSKSKKGAATIHQTESSPTVLTEVTTQYAKPASRDSPASVKSEGAKSARSKSSVEPPSVKSKRPSDLSMQKDKPTKTTTKRSVPKDTGGKVRTPTKEKGSLVSTPTKERGSSVRTPTKETVTGVGARAPLQSSSSKGSLAQTYSSERQGERSVGGVKSGSRSTASGVTAKSRSESSKASTTNTETAGGKRDLSADKSKPRMKKRDSIGSINNDSSKTGDHFGCCHGRRKQVDKK